MIDLLFITNCPAFYKINLFNELAKHCHIHVIFIGLTNQVVIDKSYKDKINFEYNLINEREIGERSKIVTFIKLCALIYKFKPQHIIYGGWDLLELNIVSLIVSKSKNSVVCESSIYESSTHGFTGFLKQNLFKRYKYAFVSGTPHAELFHKLNFKGETIVTGGVGLFSHKQKLNIDYPVNTSFKYLYTGRLIDVKNLKLLIEVFAENGKELSILGTGELNDELRSLSPSNVSFYGFVNNELLADVYSQHHCLILPSTSETWGLVVEEAVAMGIPVIVSDKVGCNIDIVENYESGIIFDSSSKKSLANAIDLMEANYEYYRKNASEINYKERDKRQVEAYLSLLL